MTDGAVFPPPPGAVTDGSRRFGKGLAAVYRIWEQPFRPGNYSHKFKHGEGLHAIALNELAVRHHDVNSVEREVWMEQG